MSVATSALIEPSLTLKRRLKASPAAVYAAWTDPKKIVRWFGPDAGPVEHAALDVRVGGRYTVIFRTEDGEQHQVGGIYREVVPNEKLVFTWAWRSTPERESLVTVLIRPDGDGSLLTLHHEKFFDEPARDRHREGWSGCLDKLVQYLSQSEEESHMAQAAARQKSDHAEASSETFHGTFCWNELMTRDIEGAKRFYRDTIGWSFEPMKVDWGTYWVAKLGAKSVGGLFELKSPEFDGVPESWMSYIAVDDVDKRVAKAVKAGAKLMKPIFDVPGVGRIAILMQPDGAGVAWMTPVTD